MFISVKLENWCPFLLYFVYWCLKDATVQVTVCHFLGLLRPNYSRRYAQNEQVITHKYTRTSF